MGGCERSFRRRERRGKERHGSHLATLSRASLRIRSYMLCSCSCSCYCIHTHTHRCSPEPHAATAGCQSGMPSISAVPAGLLLCQANHLAACDVSCPRRAQPHAISHDQHDGPTSELALEALFKVKD